MNLIIQGAALPTYLLEKFSAATGATAITPGPPKVLRDILPERIS